jgi:hypothetical protein
MKGFSLEIVRNHGVAAQPSDKMIIKAVSDQGAIIEASAIYAGYTRDATVSDYRLLQPGKRRGQDRMVHIVTKEVL